MSEPATCWIQQGAVSHQSYCCTAADLAAICSLFALISLSLFVFFFPSPPFHTLSSTHSFTFSSVFQENINIDEAANCLVKHIIASESDMLQSEVPDTITPQLEKDKGGTCSSCFRSQ